jgi:hypothetical protein
MSFPHQANLFPLLSTQRNTTQHNITMLTTYFSIILSLICTSASPIKRANNQLIVSSRDQKCLSPAGGAAAVSAGQIGNGTPLVSMDCNAAAGWDISLGSGSVVLTGTSFAMDAGVPGNNGQLKVCPL